MRTCVVDEFVIERQSEKTRARALCSITAKDYAILLWCCLT